MNKTCGPEDMGRKWVKRGMRKNNRMKNFVIKDQKMAYDLYDNMLLIQHPPKIGMEQFHGEIDSPSGFNNMPIFYVQLPHFVEVYEDMTFGEKYH